MDNLFSAKPKPFRLHRKSPLASELKSSISVKLRDFLGDYTPDVFLEYITVLICNGKDQYQARDKLEAFLGKRSGEFVSWLWDLLFELGVKLRTDTDCLDGVTAICPLHSDCSDSTKVDGCTDIGSHVNKVLMKGDKMQHSACDPASCNDMKLAKGSRHHPSASIPSTEVNTRKVLSHGHKYEVPRRFMATGDIDGEGDRRLQSKNQINQIINRKCNELPGERLHFPAREKRSKNTEFSVSGSRFPMQICAGNNLGTSLLQRSVESGSICTKISRGSVWDRLGKPLEDMSGGLKSVDFYCLGHSKQYESQSQLALIPPTRNSEVPAFDKKRSYCYPVEIEKLEHVDTAVGEPNFANNIGRKRLFGQISACLETGSDLMDHSNMDPECKDTSQNFKKSNVTCLDTDSALVDHSNIDPECKDTSQNCKKSNLATDNLKNIQKQELLDMKEKLNQMEIEMSKLRSKQVEFEKNNRKTNHLLNPGAPKESGETIDSRTVLVTNVHFAATREALSLYFAKCGVVVNVMILTDTVTTKPKGSAYVTFASKESVDRALALSGSTFFCRTLKVLRTAGAAAEALASTQLGGKTSLNISHGNNIAFPSKPHHMRSPLQWRRELATVPSEHSCPASVEAVSSSAHEQHISTSDKERTT